MGQFVSVFSEDTAGANTLLSRCLNITQVLFKQEPYALRTFGRSALASFSRQAGADESGALHVFDASDAWCLGVGSWVNASSLTAQQYAAGIAASTRKPGMLESCLADIDGSYCFVSGEMSGSRVRIATDPLGQLHVYLAELEGATLVSTSALLLAQATAAQWDERSVREFLAYGSVFEDRSLFCGVRKLAPGTIETFEYGRRTHTTAYWSVGDYIEDSPSRERSLELFSSGIIGGVERVFRQFSNPSLDLTGGFDSRILLASARRVSPGASFDTVVAGSSDDPDVIAAEHIATCLGLRHSRFDTRYDTTDTWWDMAKAALPLVDGEYNLLEYANILRLHRHLATRFGISINGSGGELIRGYWWELLFPRVGARNPFDTRRVASRRFATDLWAESMFSIPFGNALSEHFGGVVARAGEKLNGSRNTACMDNIYLMLRMQRWQGRIASATNRIWPCISPLLFRGPMQAALSAPVGLRRNGRMARQLLAGLDYKLAALPMAGGYPALPITPCTLHRFLPLGAEYLQRIRQRLVRRPQRSVSRNRIGPSLAALLQHEEVAEMLDPATMLTAGLYEPRELRSPTGSIADNVMTMGRIGRVITLESVARLSRSLPA